MSKASGYYSCKSENVWYVYDFNARPKVRKRLALMFDPVYIPSTASGLTSGTAHTNHERNASALSTITYLPTWSAAAESETADVKKLSLHTGCHAFRYDVKMCPIGELVK